MCLRGHSINQGKLIVELRPQKLILYCTKYMYFFYCDFISLGKVLTSDFVDITDRGLLLFWFLHNSYIRNLLFYSYLLSKNPFITQWVIYIHYQAFQSFSAGCQCRWHSND